MDWMRAAHYVYVFSLKNQVTEANISQRNRKPITQTDMCISLGYWYYGYILQCLM